MSMRSTWLAAAAIVGLLAACGDDPKGGAQPCAGDACGGCDEGFHEENGACVPDVRCAADTCNGHGTCDDATGKLVCTCEAAYAGQRCEDCAANHVRDGAGACVPACNDTPFTCGVSEQRPELGYAPPRFRMVKVPHLDGAAWQETFAKDVNDAGQLAGNLSASVNDAFRADAFRFSEAGGLEVFHSEAPVYGYGINEHGVVAGYGQWNAVDTAFVTDGNAIVRIGDELEGESRAGAINGAGQVVGECVIDFVPTVCRYTPGVGWESLGTGGATDIAEDGSVVGGSGQVPGTAFVWRDDGGFEALDGASIFESFAYGISPDGRRVVAQQQLPRLTEPGVGVLHDLDGDLPHRILDDVDGHPFRNLGSQPLAVNDAGFAVGRAEDQYGVSLGWLYDPRRGESHALNDLVDMPAGERWTIYEAHAIGNTGFIAATAVDADDPGGATAVLLVPLDWPTETGGARAVADRQATHEALVLPDGPEGAGTWAVGRTGDGRVLALTSVVDQHGSEMQLPAWYETDGSYTATSEEWGPLFTRLPVRVSPSGRLVGTAIVLDEFTDLRFFQASSSGGGDIEPHELPDGVHHTFGYDVDDQGALLAECYGPAGYQACHRAADGTWTQLFEGRAWGMSENGVIAGSDADDALIVADGEVTPLGLGPGAELRAVSDDGRYVAGVHGHAFVHDRVTGLFDWLPDLAGDPATVGLVEPLDVSDAGVVVGRAYDGAGESYAFSYDPLVGELVVLDELGATDLHLREAVDVDVAGAIVANGVEADGTPRGVVLLPAEP